MEENQEELMTKREFDAVKQARLEVFLKLLDKQGSLPPERHTRKRVYNEVAFDAKEIVKELFKK